jgi:hypothetical protein
LGCGHCDRDRNVHRRGSGSYLHGRIRRLQFPGYAALYAVIVNLVLSTVLTPLFDIASGSHVHDTAAGEYHAPALT